MNDFALLIAVLLIAWFAGMYVFATVGGWRTLSKRYSPTLTTGVNGELLRYVSARFGRFINYRSCLKAVVGNQGLALSVLLPFRPWHAPIHLPWSDLEIELRSKNSVEIRAKRTSVISIVVSDARLVEAVQRYNKVTRTSEPSMQQSEHKSRPVLVAIVWLIAALVGGSLMGYHSLYKLITLMDDGALATGKVESVTPADHHTLRYTFSVNGKAYSAVTTDAGFGNPPYEQMKSGSSITVTYSKDDPSISMAGLAEPAFYAQLQVVLLFAAVFGALIACICHRRGWLRTS